KTVGIPRRCAPRNKKTTLTSFEMLTAASLFPPRTPRLQVLLNNPIQRSLRPQNEFDGVTERAMPTALVGDEVCLIFARLARVGDGNRQAAMPHNRQVDYIVAYKGGLLFA